MWEDERETKRTAGDVALTEPPAAARLVVMLAVPDALPLLVALPEAEPELALAPALALALEIADVKVAAWEEEIVVVVVAGTPGAVACMPSPTVFALTHWDLAGAGCAAGVDGWPWWNVDVPYTPIGCAHASQKSRWASGRVSQGSSRGELSSGRRTSPESPRHESKEPAE